MWKKEKSDLGRRSVMNKPFKDEYLKEDSIIQDYERKKSEEEKSIRDVLLQEETIEKLTEKLKNSSSFEPFIKTLIKKEWRISPNQKWIDRISTLVWTAIAAGVSGAITWFLTWLSMRTPSS